MRTPPKRVKQKLAGDLGALVAQGEAAARERRPSEVARVVNQLQKRHGLYSSSTLFVATDWLRRLGSAEAAFKLLRPQDGFGVNLDTAWKRSRYLWAARLLNLLGAPEIAWRMIGRLEPRNAMEFRISGTIALAHFEFGQARTWFEKMIRSPESQADPYLLRLMKVNLADAYAGLGELVRATQLAEQVAETSAEPLMKGIALAAQGEYLARDKKWPEARSALKAAEGNFPEGDMSPDMGFLSKWHAYVEANLGHTEAARARFEKATRILRSSRLRPEAWIDIYRLKAHVGILDGDDLSRFASYPALAPGFRRMLENDGLRPVGAIEKVVPSPFGCRLDLARNEWTSNGRLAWDIPFELQALALLQLGGAWGISLSRLKSLLWPDEPAAFLQLEGRIQQILNRIRNRYGFRVKQVDGEIYVEPRSSIQSMEIRFGDSSLPTPLQGRLAIRRRDLEAAYGLKPSRALSILRAWVELGWIVPRGAGPASYFEVKGP